MTEYKITEDIISTDDSGINEYEYTVWEIDGFDETIMCKTIAEIPYYPNLIVKGLEKLESELENDFKPQLLLSEQIPTMNRKELLETHKYLNDRYVQDQWTDDDGLAWDLLVPRLLEKT